MMPSRSPLILLASLFALSSCVDEMPPAGGSVSCLSSAERLERATRIQVVARARGIDSGLLLAGIADAESGMAHCHAELPAACQGPPSIDCGGMPVVAGAGDGACESRLGGLGMFQFDAGDHDDTLRREGARILTLEGNVEAAIDFVIGMVIRSEYVDGVATEAEAVGWLNQVRPENALWTPWIQTVTHYYNGCRPGLCAVHDERFAYYEARTIRLVDEMGGEFWRPSAPDAGMPSFDSDSGATDCLVHR